MAEVSIPYIFVGPDGTRAVVGNCDPAVMDPDFVGYLDPENGITGILDGADVRESASDLVEGDGGTHGPFWLSRRAGTVQGLILPNADMPAANAAWAKLKRATRALRADGFLRWTPSGESIERQIRFRRQQRPTQTGRRPKAFQLAIVSADPYALSSSEASLVLVPGANAGELGIANPITNPISSPLDVASQQSVVNQGDAATWPRFRIDGPITNPQLLLAASTDPPNLVPNPSGEGASLTPWALNGPGAGLALTQADAVFGSYAFRISTDGSNSYAGMAYGAGLSAVDAGRTYGAAARFKAAAGRELRLYLSWFDGVGTLISNSTVTAIASGGWDTVSLIAAAPAGAVSARLIPRFGTVGGTSGSSGTNLAAGEIALVDGLQINPDGLGDYGDGTFPGWAWAGTPNNSSSQQLSAGEVISLVYALAAGEWLDVYPRTGQILLNGSADRYGAFDFTASKWWQLEPGINDVRLLASSFSAGAKVTIYWRHAYE